MIEHRFNGGLSRWRMARKLGLSLVGLTGLGALCLAGTAVMQWRMTAQSMTDTGHALDSLETSHALDQAQHAIRVDVIQVQQFLTDVSATRGLDGLADGFDAAAEYADALPGDIARARALAVSLNAPEVVAALDSVRDAFPNYYATGQRMARAYVSGGPALGNRTMGEFDATSLRLVGALDKVNELVVHEVESARAEQHDSQTRLAATNRLTLLLEALATVAMLAAGGILYVYVRRNLLAPLDKATGAIRGLAQGDMNQTLAGDSRADEIGDLARAFNVFRQGLIDRVRGEREREEEKARAEAERVAAECEALERSEALVVATFGEGLSALVAGNLDYRLTQDLPLAYQSLRNDFNQTMETLESLVRTINASVDSIHSGSGEISHATNDLARRTEQQAAGLEETAATLQQLTTAVTSASEAAGNARTRMAEARGLAQTGGGVVVKAVSAMDKIHTSAREISQIISVIDEIAFQTNLLALNAGVEAARAGDAGRGFAVVAQEVRALAQRSAEAAKQIKQLISTSAEQVDEGVQLVDATGRSLTDIVESVADIAALIEQIATAARQQSSELLEINGAVNQMDQVTQQNAAMVEQSSAASTMLAKDAERLSALVAHFKVGGNRALKLVA